MNTDAVICCIALDEEKYIEEWLNYHFKLGFSKIYIYDNSPNFNLNTFLKDKTNIELIHFPGSAKQLPAYEHFRTNFMNKHTWVAIIDCDEFIVLKDWMPITKFLEKYCSSGSLSLNWRLFGDSGRSKYSSEPVVDRFTMCEEKANVHVKTISKCSDVASFNVHQSNLKVGKQKDTLGNFLGNSPFNYNLTLDKAYINHYFGKSREEWQLKKARGRSDGGGIRSDNDFDRHNFNQVEDLSAKNFYHDSNLVFNVSRTGH